MTDDWYDDNIDDIEYTKLLGDLEYNILSKRMSTLGYKETIHDAKHEAEHKGFSAGVFDGAQMAMAFGQLRGLLKGLTVLVSKGCISPSSSEAQSIDHICNVVEENFKTISDAMRKSNNASVEWRALHAKLYADVQALFNKLQLEPPTVCPIVDHSREMHQSGHRPATTTTSQVVEDW